MEQGRTERAGPGGLDSVPSVIEDHSGSYPAEELGGPRAGGKRKRKRNIHQTSVVKSMG